MPVGRNAACLALALLLAAPAGAAAQKVYRTDPGHMRPPGTAPEQSRVPPVWYPYVPRVVAREPDKEWRKAGKVNPKLSDACARREFGERATMRFRAIYKDGILGVAFGYGLNLVDAKGQARLDRIYYFKNANSSACTVLEGPNRDPRVLELLDRQRQQGGP